MPVTKHIPISGEMLLPPLEQRPQSPATLPAFNIHHCRRLVSEADNRARAVESWARLMLRRLELDKPVGPETYEILSRLCDLAIEDAAQALTSLRRVQTILDGAWQS